jgi:hypothetical protein
MPCRDRHQTIERLLAFLVRKLTIRPAGLWRSFFRALSTWRWVPSPKAGCLSRSKVTVPLTDPLILCGEARPGPAA